MRREHFQVSAADQVRISGAALRQMIPSIFAQIGANTCTT